MTKKEQIIEEIRKIYDPELPVNIYELGLIYDVQVENDNHAKIKMTLTTPNCPVAESLPKEVKDGAMQVEEIDDVDLQLVWDPPRIKEIMSQAEKEALGVRVSVKSGGCAGMSYVMEYTKEANPSDEVIEDKGVKVFVDSAAIMYLLGTEMDYKKEELSSSFVFNNPNETERCGCGESFKVE